MKQLLVVVSLSISMLLSACNLPPQVTPTALPTETPKQTQQKTNTPTPTPEPSATPQVFEMVPVDPVIGIPQGTDGLPWWNDSVFYEIFVRSFYDSNGDGNGDLNGITQKLDYLNDGDPNTQDDLGITGIWLMPIHNSPSYHGYNAIDHYEVNPDYGTLDDLKNLVNEAHVRNMRVILDLVLDITSSENPWFVSGINPASPYHNWYIWSDVDPGYLGSWGQQVWFPLNGKYFYSAFSAYSPDLNYLNPDVRAEAFNIAKYWLEETGIDGFRLDAAKHLIEEGTNQVNTDSTHQFWKEFRVWYKSINPQAMTVGEIWEDTPIMAKYLQGDEFDLSFEFYLAELTIQAINAGNVQQINERLQMAYDLIPNQQFAVFLTNHDQERVMSRFFDNDEKVKAAASIMLTNPGTPFVYYGEEIGMQGDQIHEWSRRPMQWSGELNSGFSTATPWEPLGPAWYDYNVAEETGDPDSLLSHYRNLIRIRNEHAALRVGALSVVDATNPGLYSILRVSQKEAVLVLVNITGEPISDFFLAKSNSALQQGLYSAAVIMGDGQFEAININAIGGFFHHVDGPEIPPYGTVILQLHRN